MGGGWPVRRRALSARYLSWTIKRGLLRLRWPGLLGATLLVVAAGFALFGVQPARDRLRALDAQRAELASRAGSPQGQEERPTQRGQLGNFYAFFPLTEAVPEMLGKIQRAAERNDLTLAKGEYKLAEERDFRLARYQVTLPVTGAYSQVRGFVNDVLDAVPSAALDELTLKREAIGDDALEARVRFTLYLGGE
jgi:Tfp pilus assembly protein PilO